MTKRKNEYGLTYLVMCPVLQIVDPATQAVLQLKSTVEFYPDAFLPEFVEIQNSIKQKIERQKMPVEKAADELINLFNEYEPKKIKMRVDIINNNTYFPVSVIVESSNVSEDNSEKDNSGKKPPKKTPEKDGVIKDEKE